MGFKKPLPHVLVPMHIACGYLELMQSAVELVDNMSDYQYGYSDNKKLIRFGEFRDSTIDNRVFITRATDLQAYLTYCTDERIEAVEKQDGWKQLLCRIVFDDNNANIAPINGLQAYLGVMKILGKYYTKDEIDLIMNKHSVERDPNNIQVHYTNKDIEQNLIYYYPNCIKYDINGAHHSVLCELFPKASKDFEQLFINRKLCPETKMLINFFVGYLCRVGYRGTYNWIIQRATNLLMKKTELIALDMDAEVLYVNTDGILVSNGIQLPTSDKLGDFRLEYKGPACICWGNNYWIYQTKDEIKGSMPLKIRNKVNLFEGKTVEYKSHRKNLVDRYGNLLFKKYDYADVKEVKYDVHKK